MTVAIPVQVTFDCHDPDALAHFWAELLDYRLDPPPPGYDSWEAWLREQGIPEADWNMASAVSDPEGRGPRLFFQRVSEPKQVKNRVHLDVNVGGPRGAPPDERRVAVDAAVERATGIGAVQLRLVEERGERHYVMQDPEGNEFCLQ
jgi:hypothetical protein